MYFHMISVRRPDGEGPTAHLTLPVSLRSDFPMHLGVYLQTVLVSEGLAACRAGLRPGALVNNADVSAQGGSGAKGRGAAWLRADDVTLHYWGDGVLEACKGGYNER